MKLKRNENDFDRLLDALPREQAGAGFTDAVIRRLDEAARGRRHASEPGFAGRRLRLALAASLAVALAAALLFALRTGPKEAPKAFDRAARHAELEALQQEHASLEAELRQLRDLTREGQPLLYLGGDENLSFVLDLARDDLAFDRDESGTVRPAAFRGL